MSEKKYVRVTITKTMTADIVLTLEQSLDKKYLQSAIDELTKDYFYESTSERKVVATESCDEYGD